MKPKIILILILILAVIVRFYNLTGVPVALNGDEAAFGYNAYSILHTLHDEHGQFLPWTFKSFGDFKPPILVYLLVPIEAVFGLNELVVRMPIAFVSTLLILLIYLIAKKIYSSEPVALLSAFFSTISMWAIQFSRATWEASLALFFFTLAIYLFLLSLEKRKWLIPSLVLFMVSFYTYHAEKVAVPVMLVALNLIFKSQLHLKFKKVVWIIVLILILALPALLEITNFSGQSRVQGSLTLSYLFQPSQTKTLDLTAGLIPQPNQLYHLVSNLTLGSSDIIAHVLAYLSPAQLFIYGDPVGRHGVEDFGVLYLFDAIFLVATFYFLSKKQKQPNDYFLLIWLLIGLLPGMITVAPIHVIRSLLAIPPLYILEGWGAVELFKKIKSHSNNYYYLSLGISVLIVGVYLARFLQSYFIYTPIIRSYWWQYGIKEVALLSKHEEPKVDRIIFETPDNWPVVYGNPYMDFLFFNKIDPNFYNQTVVRRDDFKNKAVPVFSFGKYQFRQIYWPNDKSFPHTLLIGTKDSIPQDVMRDPQYKFKKEIFLPDGYLIFRIVEIP